MDLITVNEHFSWGKYFCESTLVAEHITEDAFFIWLTQRFKRIFWTVSHQKSGVMHFLTDFG
jgi:hypothetical protein